MAKWIAFSENIRRKTSIAKQLDDKRREEVQQNREYLRVLIECLVFTAQQNIAQRGHREGRHDIGSSSDINRGNFLELLHMRCKDIPWLQDKLNSQLKHHQQWTSWKIQNELLQIIADLILERVQTEIGDSMFSIIMDENSGIGKTEKVSLCLSYVHEGIKKRFLLDFLKPNVPIQSLLFNLAKDAIQSVNLDLKNIVGLCFDGASNMCSIHGGLATLMKETSPLSIYAHCYAHRFNLALRFFVFSASFKNYFRHNPKFVQFYWWKCKESSFF